MSKNFDSWNRMKKSVNDEESRLYTVREIWWCALGVNVGFEQDGTGDEFRRPVVILAGYSAQTCLVVPLTTSSREHQLRPSVGIVDGKEARALLS